LINKNKKAVLICLERQGSDVDVDLLAEELTLLLANLGITVVGRVDQKRTSPDPATFIGKGKLYEMKALISNLDASLVVCNDSLLPTQLHNIRSILEVEVWDRPFVIMKIFEARAYSAEAKLQVELALCKYEIPLLKGLGRQMSQPGGGIGTRGPGETEFERHRRKLERRAKTLQHKLEKVRKSRLNSRKRRKRNDIPTIAIVGYTNSGKSTLLKALSHDDEIYCADKLFATLDPKVRRVKLPSGKFALFADTVGFIRKLPIELVAAFRATLEEVSEASLLLIVIDPLDKDPLESLTVVEETLNQIGAACIPRIIVLNKIDMIDSGQLEALLERLAMHSGSEVVPVSALRKINTSSLLRRIESSLMQMDYDTRSLTDTFKLA
jgi:GTP-binding protein HflX